MEDKRPNFVVMVSKYWRVVTTVGLLLRFRVYHEWRLLLEASIYRALGLLVVRQKVVVSTLEALRPSYRLFLVNQ